MSGIFNLQFRATSTGPQILGLPAPGTVNVTSTHGGLAASSTHPGLSMTYTHDDRPTLTAIGTNPGKAAVTLNAATGAISGNFSRTETAPALIDHCAVVAWSKTAFCYPPPLPFSAMLPIALAVGVRKLG